MNILRRMYTEQNFVFDMLHWQIRLATIYVSKHSFSQPISTFVETDAMHALRKTGAFFHNVWRDKKLLTSLFNSTTL